MSRTCDWCRDVWAVLSLEPFWVWDTAPPVLVPQHQPAAVSTAGHTRRMRHRQT